MNDDSSMQITPTLRIFWLITTTTTEKKASWQDKYVCVCVCFSLLFAIRACITVTFQKEMKMEEKSWETNDRVLASHPIIKKKKWRILIKDRCDTFHGQDKAVATSRFHSTHSKRSEEKVKRREGEWPIWYGRYTSGNSLSRSFYFLHQAVLPSWRS